MKIPTHKIVKQKREKLGLTKKEFSDALGMPKGGEKTLSQWELGEKIPSPSQLNLVINFPEEPPFKNDPTTRYKIADLFAGIGGIRLGFNQTQKVQTVFSSEIDKFATKTYKANFGDTPQGDITEIESQDIPDHDILVGGFPCQAFSQAGLRKGFEDTRGTLFFHVARILNEKQPQAFLLENVKNLRSHDKGKTLRTILDTLDEVGYTAHYEVLKARDFGVPQNRERIYIVGFRKDIDASNFKYPDALNIPTRLGDILEPEVDEKYTISDRLWQGHQRRKIKHQESGKGFGYTLFNEESPYTNTISARYYKDGSEILIAQEGKNPRRLTPREAARLQGFPEEFIIPVSDTQAYKQFGNSVAVPVIHAIATNMLKVLDNA